MHALLKADCMGQTILVLLQPLSLMRVIQASGVQLLQLGLQQTALFPQGLLLWRVNCSRASLARLQFRQAEATWTKLRSWSSPANASNPESLPAALSEHLNSAGPEL